MESFSKRQMTLNFSSKKSMGENPRKRHRKVNLKLSTVQEENVTITYCLLSLEYKISPLLYLHVKEFRWIFPLMGVNVTCEGVLRVD